MTPTFRINGAFVLSEMESYDHAYTNALSCFEKCWREAARLLLCSKNFHLVALDISSSLLISADFFVVSTVANT